MILSNFLPKRIDLGDVKVGKVVKVVFHKNSDTLKIKEIKSSCGCSKPELKGNNLIVEYRPQPVPEQLKTQGFYFSTKTIEVHYENGSKELLSFKAKVFAK